MPIDQDLLRRQWQGFRHFAGLAFFTLAGIGLVVAAALIIAIIQFQIRIIEAKNQSKNFSLTSLTQSVAMQKEFVRSIELVQSNEQVIAEYQDFQGRSYASMSQFVSLICLTKSAEEDQKKCAYGISGALLGGAAEPVYFLSVISHYTGYEAEKFPVAVKPVVEAAVALAAQRTKFANSRGPQIVQIRSACDVIERYVTVPSQRDAPWLRSDRNAAAEKNSMLQDFSREYVLAARMRCFTNFNLGTPPVSNELIKTLTVTPGSQPTASGAMLTTISSPTAAGTEKRDNLEADLAWSLFFDLISYYRFYEHVIGPPLTELVVSSPVDISFIVLVIICGALGSMLRITAERYHPQLFGNNSSMKERRPPVYYFLIGVMCSLIIYILAKSAFAGITEATYAAKSANLSPFVTAFLAVVSGLLCEEAFNQIITSGKSVLARSGTTQRGSKP